MSINGQLLRDAVISGANNVKMKRVEVDELNVFPVPDGDTGTNMSMTIGSAVLEMSNTADGAAVGDVAKKAASAMLRGARGNSGVILSLLFRGISKGLAGKTEANAAEFSDALKLGVDAAYKAVMKPTEGTILTVAREAWENTEKIASKACFENYFALLIDEAKKSLEKTPELLPVLKKAGVVDAGGMGLIVVLEGMYSVISGGKIIEDTSENKPTGAVAQAKEAKVEYGYGAEFVIVRRAGSKDLSALTAVLETIGNSIAVVDEDDYIRVNIHTNHPGKVLEEGLKFGSLTKISIVNLSEKTGNLVKAAKNNRKKPVEPTNEFGFVAVAAGAGIEALFKDLGADNVVSGGQTMNPSTEDILEAVGQTPAKCVFVLPNNKNIIMAAEQAARLSDRKVCVLQTRNIPQGISAMMSFDSEADFAANRAAMTEAFDRVSSGQITYAVRDSDYSGHKIRQGEILAMENGKIVFTEKTVEKALTKLVKRMVTSSSSYVTIMYGADVPDDEAEAAYEQLSAKMGTDVELNLVNGGQPVYYYLISVE